MEERSVQIFIPYERSFSLVFWKEEWLMRAISDTWYLKSWVKLTPLKRKADFQSIFAVAPQLYHLAKKSSINANRKSTTRFPMIRWTSYVAPKLPRRSKTQNGRFPTKSHIVWRKSATKFLCVKTVCDIAVRHSLAYLSARKWLVGSSSCTWKFGGYWPTRRFSIYFRPYSASAVTPSEKVQLTLIWSLRRALQWA